MEFNPGTGATILATTIENQCYSLARSIQQFERNSSYNPENSINLINSASNDDTQVFSGGCQIYINSRLGFKGQSLLEVPNPYVNLPNWQEGENGQGKAENWVEGLVERFQSLAFIERQETYNPEKTEPRITDVSWTLLDDFLTLPVVHNCIFSFDFTFNFRIVDSRNGTTSEAIPYLQGNYPGVG
ncbi:MAG: hypothetical protein AAGF85_20860 [Bacteroidota bacterium]